MFPNLLVLNEFAEPTVIFITSLENPDVDFILAGISMFSPCHIVMLDGEVDICRIGGGIVTQFVNCLTSFDLYDSAV